MIVELLFCQVLIAVSRRTSIWCFDRIERCDDLLESGDLFFQLADAQLVVADIVDGHRGRGTGRQDVGTSGRRGWVDEWMRSEG